MPGAISLTRVSVAALLSESEPKIINKKKRLIHHDHLFHGQSNTDRRARPEAQVKHACGAASPAHTFGAGGNVQRRATSQGSKTAA
jgi:hypothetical protein